MERPIVVGVDGSPSSRDALRWAIAEARLRGCPLKAVTAWHVPWAGYEGVPLPDDLPSEMERAAREVVAEAVARLGTDAEGVDIRAVVVEGDSARVLIDEAREACLLVVGSRGLGGFRELLLGSVSQQCAHHAGCPVVIVRHHGEEAGEGEVTAGD